MAHLLFDTDILIDYLRGRPEAVTFIDGVTDELLMSVVTLAELYAGVREGEERGALDAFARAFELVPLDAEIAMKGGLIRRDYRKSHNIGLPDALIAAKVQSRQAMLVTLNAKHFPMLADVIAPY